MQVVIDISKEQYSLIMQSHRAGVERFISKEAMMYAIKNGILLPKGHGRLKDADKLTKEIKGYISDTSNLHYDDLEEAEAYNSAYYNCLAEIEDIPTIIEADIGSEK